MILGRIQTRLAAAADFHARTGRPYCTITYAQSIDGSIATKSGGALAISGADALRMTHRLRASHDAILVGIDTVLTDNPMLTVRLVEGEHPQPVVLDSNLRFPTHARMLDNPKRPWVVSGEEHMHDARKAALEEKGVRVLHVPRNGMGHIDLPQLLRCLGALGMRSVMIEGGARVITSFLELRLGNQLIVTISPRLVGGLHPMGTRPESCLYPALSQTVYEQWGADMVLVADLEWQHEQAAQPVF